MSTKVINISCDSTDWRAHALSNFTCFPFILDELLFASVEGFIQGIKFPPCDPRRQQAFLSWDAEAKRFGKEAEQRFVWWNDDQFPYNNDRHRQLVERAIRAKFFHNEGAVHALVETRDAVLTHDVGPEDPNTSLPAYLFCEILTALRTQLLAGDALEEP